MEVQFENTLNMYYVVQDYCKQNDHIWETDVPFKIAFELFVAKLPEIEQNRNQQSKNLTGLTQEKNQKKLDLAQKAYYIANRLQSYAEVNQKLELLNKVNFTENILSRMRETNLIGVCTQILDSAKAELANLSIYKVTQDNVDALKAALKTYQNILGKPRAAKSTTVTATANLPQLFKETNEILKKRLDRDIEVFKISHPDFYNGYFSSRKVIKVNKSALALRVTVLDAANREPIPNVKAKLAGKTIIKKTSEKGGFQLNNLSEGTYQFTFEKNGYISQTISFVIINGETTVLEVLMVGM